MPQWPADLVDRIAAIVGAITRRSGLFLRLHGRPQQPEFARPGWSSVRCPLVVGDHIYVHPGGPNGKSIAALDKRNGSVVWQALDDPLGPSSPISAEVHGAPQIIFLTGRGAVGVAPQDGKLLWRYPWKTRFDLNIATPVYADGKVFISSNYGTGGAVVRITDKEEPETMWKALTMQNHFSTSVLYGGSLYGFSDQRLRCVDFQTGKLLWGKAGLGKGGPVSNCDGGASLRLLRNARSGGQAGLCGEPRSDFGRPTGRHSQRNDSLHDGVPASIF